MKEYNRREIGWKWVVLREGKRMNQREIASIGCKLIGIFFIVQGSRLLSLNVPVAANMIAKL